MRYTVQWRYASSYGGPWDAGTVVDLDTPVAEAINRDSPGVLAPAARQARRAGSRAPDGPTQDRAMRAPGRKRGA